MNNRTEPLVRPVFRKWTLVALIVLAPFVSHAACDYAESRRLATIVQQIRDAREPTTVWEATPVHYLKGDAARSARYYRAAAALGAADASPHGPEWSTDSGEALEYLKRAAELPFEGFASPASMPAQLMQVARVASARAHALADTGEAKEAGALLYAHARLERAMESGWIGSWPMIYQLSGDVGYVLSRASLDEVALDRLAKAFADMDRDDTQKQYLLRQRAFLLENMRSDRNTSWLTRPIILRALNDRLDEMRSLIDLASQAWPRRLDSRPRFLSRTSLLDAWALGNQASIVSMRDVDESQFHAFATSTARIRSIRLVIAAEQYRRANPSWPPSGEALVPRYLPGVLIDPFRGEPMKTIAERDGGFVAYSVGLNNRDDHGHLEQQAGVVRPGVSPAMAVGDIGIRITLEH